MAVRLPPLHWAGFLSGSATMGHRIKRALEAQPTTRLTEARRGIGICQGPPHARPIVLQCHLSQAPKTSSAYSRRGRAQPHRKMRGKGLTLQTPPDLRHLGASQTVRTNHLWAKMGRWMPCVGEHLAQVSDSETPILGSVSHTADKRRVGLEQELRTNTSDGLRTRIPNEPVGKA